MNSPGADDSTAGDDANMSSLKKKLAAAKLQDEKYENDNKEAATADLFRRISQQVVSTAVLNAVDKVSASHK